VIKHKKKAISSGSLLNEVLESIGEGAQLLGSEGLAIKVRGVISTQCVSIDAAIGRGGIPLGRLTILHGAEGSGKTTLALHIVAECQRQNGVAIYMDKEYKLDPDYARSGIGVDTSRLIIVQPPYLERVFDNCHKIIQKAAAHRTKTGKRVPILIVLDSMNAAITKAEFEGEWEDKHMAQSARAFSQLLPKLMPQVHKEDVALLFISQIRQKFNVMFGNADEVAGGNAPKHWASLILKVTRLGANKEGDEKVSNKIRVECVKNQIAPPFKKAECDIVYGHGIDKESSLIWLAEKNGVIKRSGSTYTYADLKIAIGIKALAKKLKEDRKLFSMIKHDVREVGW